MFTGREFNEYSDGAYYAYITKNQIPDTLQNRTMFNAGFYRGSQYAMRISSELSPHVARFIEFIMWLTERQETE